MQCDQSVSHCVCVRVCSVTVCASASYCITLAVTAHLLRALSMLFFVPLNQSYRSMHHFPCRCIELEHFSHQLSHH